MSDPTEDTIQLDQFLKLNGVAASGGEAKHMIKNGQVIVNGEVETRRGRKLRAGDIVQIERETITVEKSN